MLISNADIIYNPPMRTLIDIPASQIAALSTLCDRLKQPRAAIVRAAISEYLARHHQPDAEDAFGLWGAAAQDGVAYQREVRGEW